ncbi:MAG: glycosyl transferase, group 1 [Ilumatobacteraceae bacterium]|nr:glycosyl transferase, group 1 [Ilumatobacteraceae bacterium]
MQAAPGATEAALRSSVTQLLGPSTGGIRAHVAELSRRLAERGWWVEVLGPPHVMVGVGRQDGVVDVPTSWNPVAVLRARRQLRLHLAAHPADVLHAHGLKAALVVLTLRRRRRPPAVLTVHNLVTGTRHGVSARVLSRVERSIIRRADHVVVISDEIDQRLTGLVPDARRTFVLPVSPQRSVGRSRHDVRAEYGIADDAPMVAIVARHHVQKDLPMFLRAFADVVRELPAARAVMVGDGPERRALETLREQLGLTAAVTIAGHRPNPVDEMSAADVVALSSRWEGSPLAIAECLSLGRPLVTTAVGTVTRHLTDRVDARVVPVGDDRAFAAALLDELRDPTGAAAMGQRGREVSTTTFDPELLVDGIEAIYRSSVHEGATQTA